MKDFRDLNVWEKSHNLTIRVYKSTDYKNLDSELIEIKIMLAVLFKKLKADC
jgi:hypothetical protein